jgi:hypothetical protein
MQEEFSIVLTSNKYSGANNVSNDGSKFTVQLTESLRIPNDALNCNISMDSASVWWSVNNIKAGINDTLYIHGLTTTNTETDFIIVIPSGLYDLQSLNSKIQQLLENQDGKILPYNNIELIADNATQRVVIKFNYSVVTMNFTTNNTPRVILGFDSQIYGPYVGAPENVFAPNIAEFNSIDSFLIHCDLVDRGILYNNGYSQIVGQVLIDVSPGSQIIYNPYNPSKVEANNLIGGNRRAIRVWLTDQNNNAVDTNGEIFSLKLRFQFIRQLKN